MSGIQVSGPEVQRPPTVMVDQLALYVETEFLNFLTEFDSISLFPPPSFLFLPARADADNALPFPSLPSGSRSKTRTRTSKRLREERPNERRGRRNVANASRKTMTTMTFSSPS